MYIQLLRPSLYTLYWVYTVHFTYNGVNATVMLHNTKRVTDGHVKATSRVCRACYKTHCQKASNLCTTAQFLKVWRGTKCSLSTSSVISAKPADKWAVNRVNSGHMYRPFFNYLVVNPAKRSPVTAQHSSASPYRCLTFSLRPLAYNWGLIFNNDW